MPDNKGLSNTRIQNLMSEIKMAEAFNKEEIEPIAREAIERYCGDYVPAFGADWDIVLNEIYPIIQNNLPSIFFRTPRAFLKPRNKTYIAKKRDPITGKMENVQMDSQKSANTQSAIVNYQISDKKYKKQTRKVLLDALLFPHGVMWHGYKGEWGMTDENDMFIKSGEVFFKRISPMRFIKDPCVSFFDLDEGQWVGRIIDIRLEDLLADKELDVDKKQIKGIPGFGEKVGTATAINKQRLQGSDITSIHKKDLLSYADESFKKSDASKFVKAYEIFLRANKEERNKGYKGWILLLTDEQDRPLRVNEWKIKAEGFPAHLLQFNEVPDKMMGISDIKTYASIADQKNVIVNLQIRNAQENTKVWVGLSRGGVSEEDVERVQQGENTILVFDGDIKPSERMFVASPGGQASSELYIIDQRIQRNLEDKSGVTDLKRGFLQSGEESAASVKIRAAGQGARPAYRQDIMADFLMDSIHYIVQLNRQFIPFDEAVRITGTLDVVWSENPSEQEIQADTDIEIDVTSMLPESPETELQNLQQTLALMVQGLSDPNISQKLAQEGKVMNLSPIIEQILLRQKIKDPDIFRSIRPEESQGYVSVAELRAARENVNAALQGNGNIPSPPAEGQDHVARLEVYGSILNLIQGLGESIASEILNQLVMVHQQLLQAEQEKNDTPGQRVNLKKPSISRV